MEEKAKKSPKAKLPPKQKRRPRGSGTVEEIKTPNGARYVAKKQKAGHPPLYGTRRSTWDEAHADLAALSFEVQPEKPTYPAFRDFMRTHLMGRRKKELSYGTWKRDEITWRTRVWESDLGRTPVNEISDDGCQAFIDGQRKLVPKLDGEGRPLLFLEVDGAMKPVPYRSDGKPSAKGAVKTYVPGSEELDLDTLQRIGATISVYLEIARKKPYRYLAANPMADVEYPKRRKDEKTRKSLTPQQAAGLKGNLLQFTTTLRSQGDRFEAMVLTARDTGFRRGELCGLKWERVQRARGVYFVAVDAGLTRGEKGLVDSGTKSGNLREVPITQETYDRIMAQPRRSAYVFTTESGSPVRPDNFTRDFRGFRDALGMPDLTPHKLRHTYVSLLLRAGMGLKDVQKLVGHATPKMIMEVYAETFDDTMLLAPEKLASLLKDAEEIERQDEKAA